MTMDPPSYPQQLEQLAVRALGNSAWPKLDAAKKMAMTAGISLTLPDGGTNGVILAQHQNAVDTLLVNGFLEDVGSGEVRVADAEKRQALRNAGEQPLDPYAMGHHQPAAQGWLVQRQDEFGRWADWVWKSEEDRVELARVDAIRRQRALAETSRQLGIDLTGLAQ